VTGSKKINAADLSTPLAQA